MLTSGSISLFLLLGAIRIILSCRPIGILLSVVFLVLLK